MATAVAHKVKTCSRFGRTSRMQAMRAESGVSPRAACVLPSPAVVCSFFRQSAIVPDPPSCFG
eukprot:2368336-Pleurochrysis_carterae.AAC.2